MRNKYQGTLAAAFIALFGLATACGDDSGGTPSGNEAGESGAGASSGGGGKGSGGKSSAGNGGTLAAGDGGQAMADAGDTSVNGGHASGEGGTPSTGGGEPSGGNASGNGGEPPGGHGGAGGGAGGAGGADDGNCTPITLNAFGEPQIAPENVVYLTSFTPNIVGAAADNFSLEIQASPYDGDRTGTFDLTQNGDDNYLTCARCILVYADAGQKTFYASAGTLEIAAGSKQLGGTMDATITNLKLVEVTIDDDAISTPVPDGACLTVASATIHVEAPPCSGFECNNGYCLTDSALECDGSLDFDCSDGSDEFPVNASCEPVWLCNPDWYGDGDCDCGCGIKDLDCTGTTDETECEFCLNCQDEAGGCNDNEVNPANTTMCL
jgi:hypothetical protein